MTEQQKAQVQLQEQQGYVVYKNVAECTILKQENADHYIKVDSDGYVVPFTPILEG